MGYPLWFKKHATIPLLLLLLILLVPTFWRLIRPGIFSMHDFHVFRLYEYDKCVADLQIPCRWAPDSAYEYGEPMFNFYAQLPYAFGEFFRFLGFSVLDSIKALFISSLVLSATAMFLLAKQFWGNNLSALISALIYVYAPYRAVDVWVRGALPEALAFIFFPLITYFFNDYVFNKNTRSLFLFGVSLAGLILTHNLSVLMFLVFFSFWAIYFFTKYKAWNLLPKFILLGILVFGLTAFYTLPVAFESKLITLTETTKGYYDFNLHFVTLKQLLISRYWGYGASQWGEDDRLSLSVGQIQWILPVIIAVLVLIKKRQRQYLSFFFLLGLGWFMLLLTHNKSVLIWDLVKPLSFVQFPWRFLGSAVFLFAFASGAMFTLFKKSYLNKLLFLVVTTLLISLNTSFFFEDLWFKFDDREFFSGKNYEQQVTSAIHDFWPKTGSKIPANFAPKAGFFLEGMGSAKLIEKRSNKQIYTVDSNQNSVVQFPLVYFPGWEGFSDNKKINLSPSGEYGLVTVNTKPADKIINLKFVDTPIRVIGNFVSAVSVGALVIFLIFFKRKKII
ncbi:hypothetical protein HYW46_05850 [Candidatus Daviesbacteria bacterium]|nr:hypothetical protein [Candidatus Daviesbacteria bacterium]